MTWGRGGPSDRSDKSCWYRGGWGPSPPKDSRRSRTVNFPQIYASKCRYVRFYGNVANVVIILFHFSYQIGMLIMKITLWLYTGELLQRYGDAEIADNQLSEAVILRIMAKGHTLYLIFLALQIALGQLMSLQMYMPMFWNARVLLGREFFRPFMEQRIHIFDGRHFTAAEAAAKHNGPNTEQHGTIDAVSYWDRFHSLHLPVLENAQGVINTAITALREFPSSGGKQSLQVNPVTGDPVTVSGDNVRFSYEIIPGSIGPSRSSLLHLARKKKQLRRAGHPWGGDPYRRDSRAARWMRFKRGLSPTFS